MKYLQLLVLLLFISSCSSTKTTQTKLPEIVKTNDSITKKIIPIETKNKTDNIAMKSNPDDNNQNNNFNQILTKREIDLHQLWDELLSKHVSEDGMVNYKTFKNEHKKLLDYIYVLSLFYKQDGFKSISKEEKLAYWINAYNAFTIDLILRHYPVKSIKDIKDPWKQRLWKIAEIPYNLEEIEHEILRKMDEPRIHFAIVCASFSCPKLQNEAFKSSNLDEQLTKATKDFLGDSKRNSISKKELELSKIFQWFSKDFKQNGNLIDFLNQYSEVEISENAKKSFKDYNWNLNE